MWFLLLFPIIRWGFNLIDPVLPRALDHALSILQNWERSTLNRRIEVHLKHNADVVRLLAYVNTQLTEDKYVQFKGLIDAVMQLKNVPRHDWNSVAASEGSKTWDETMVSLV